MDTTGLVESTIRYLKTRKSLQTKCIKAECIKFLHYLEENKDKDILANKSAYNEYRKFLVDNKVIPS